MPQLAPTGKYIKRGKSLVLGFYTSIMEKIGLFEKPPSCPSLGERLTEKV
jgi:hypothetical protein